MDRGSLSCNIKENRRLPKDIVKAVEAHGTENKIIVKAKEEDDFRQCKILRTGPSKVQEMST